MNTQDLDNKKNIPRRRTWFWYAIGRFLLFVGGWKIVGDLPDEKKVVLAVAPHTSNWDFVVGISAVFTLGLKLSFIGKDTLFDGPLGPLMRNLGGHPVDRTESHGVVDQVVGIFESHDKFWFGVAPEGTRKSAQSWRSGFYQIAHQAGVGVLPIAFDFEKREVQIKPLFKTCGDFEKDLPLLLEQYKDVSPGNPDQLSLPLKALKQNTYSDNVK